MLDAQLHYPVFESYPRNHIPSGHAPVAKRGVRRIFRVGESRPRDVRTR
jgi:hypothetical protein